MLFNSLEFIIFLALFFAAWPLMRRGNNRRWVYLLVASFFFYGWWDWRFLFLITFSGFIDYFSGLAMVRWPRRRKPLLVASILGNVGSLGVFKYLDFLIGNINWLAEFLGSSHPLPYANLILPVGISFYTFQSMSYTIDIYRGKLEPTKNVFHFFAYLSMFPQLVAGPIVRAAHLLPQLEKVARTTEKQRWEGLTLIAYGYFKKVVVADSLAPAINDAFSSSSMYDSGAYWWLILIMFSFQIYCDFSGYSDIARGLARWMGYDFPLNFNHPYIATSIREFWSRWHISLSTWFRDYVYIPLGGSQRGNGRGMFNMAATMLISGLWHGAAWTFVVWGGLHAFYLTLERLTDWTGRLERIKGGRHAAVVIIFVLVLFSWVFFRAESFGQAGYIIGRLLDFGDFKPGTALGLIRSNLLFLTLIMILRQAYFHFGFDQWSGLNSRVATALHPVAVAILFTACVFFRGPGSAFIYFQF